MNGDRPSVDKQAEGRGHITQELLIMKMLAFFFFFFWKKVFFLWEGLLVIEVTQSHLTDHSGSCRSMMVKSAFLFYSEAFFGGGINLEKKHLKDRTLI